MTVRIPRDLGASQRSLHNAPIFRLLLKVAVKGTHQCDFLNFCGALVPQHFGEHLAVAGLALSCSLVNGGLQHWTFGTVETPQR